MTATQNPLLPLLVSGLQSEVCPEAGGSAGRTKLLWYIWI